MKVALRITLALLAIPVLISSTAGQGMMHGKGGMMGKMMGAQCHKMMGHCHKMIADCHQKDGKELRDMLKSDKEVERFSAACAIGNKRLPLTGDLIGLLTDRSDPVRQAARRSLILLSYHVDALNKARQKVVPRYVDYGPVPNARLAAQKQAVRNWSAWATRNDRALKRLATELPPMNPGGPRK